MAHTTTAQNPFMLMLEPDVVLAAVEKSERLSKLNRHLCRPLDRPVLGDRKAEALDVAESDDIDSDDDLEIAAQ